MAANKSWTVFLATASLVLTLACECSLGAAKATETVEKRFPLQAGGSFMLDNVNGAVTLTAWDQPEVAVTAVKKARGGSEQKAREALQKTEIVFTAEPSSVRVETKYQKKKGFTFFGGCGVDVAYDVKVPRGTKVAVETVNGAVTIEAPGSPVQCESVNGAVEVKGATTLKAETVNGQVVFTAASVESVETTNGAIEGRLEGPQQASGRIETVNGSIELKLAPEIQIQVEGENVNGSVECAIPGFSVQKHRLGGALNGGGPQIRVETVNGSISVEVSGREAI